MLIEAERQYRVAVICAEPRQRVWLVTAVLGGKAWQKFEKADEQNLPTRQEEFQFVEVATNFMKKVLTLVFTMAVALAMGAPVFAAPTAESVPSPISLNAQKPKKATKKAKTPKTEKKPTKKTTKESKKSGM
jgi:outer membrane biosynthesis protein TonB